MAISPMKARWEGAEALLEHFAEVGAQAYPAK